MIGDSVPHGPAVEGGPPVVMLSGRVFLVGCAAVAGIIVLIGRTAAMPTGLLAAEVLATILGLFFLGSFKYQVHKNALTYGMLLIIVATFCGLRTSTWHVEIAQRGWIAWIRHHLLSFQGLDDLIHADTMLFILGLTLLVSVIAQTRLLEAVTFFTLRRNRGVILPTVISVTAVVAVASGVLGGVSMIGLTIRTLVIMMMMAAAPVASVRYAVIVCTAVTTICGIWLAYGEPPNLIMMANLYPHLDNAFFVRYGLPASVAPASRTRAMPGWSIIASACRSASNRAITCRVSIPTLMSFRATSRRTGRSCCARNTLPKPPSPMSRSNV